jgi:hypothetical protein
MIDVDSIGVGMSRIVGDARVVFGLMGVLAHDLLRGGNG